jgi:branched-subunit amino acid transport protein
MVAWKTKNALITVAVGMTVLLVLQAMLATSLH